MRDISTEGTCGCVGQTLRWLCEAAPFCLGLVAAGPWGRAEPGAPCREATVGLEAGHCFTAKPEPSELVPHAWQRCQAGAGHGAAARWGLRGQASTDSPRAELRRCSLVTSSAGNSSRGRAVSATTVPVHTHTGLAAASAQAQPPEPVQPQGRSKPLVLLPA